MITQNYLDQLTYKIIGCAIEVHKELGPGLLESIYEKCLIHELKLNGFEVKNQMSIPLFYKGIDMDCNLRFDVLVNDLVVVELKSVVMMHPIFEAVLMTYMKLLLKPKGILFNFNCRNLFHDGQKTFVNEFYAKLPKE
ncbi:MAG TPA: GxxExxY protein [Prolixibacteraceae bacterium]|nr:GxxExxY protein [Prolixibacteraceae bacterium]